MMRNIYSYCSLKMNVFSVCMQYYELMCILLYFSLLSVLTILRKKNVSLHFSSFKIINQYCQQSLILNEICFAFTRTKRIRNSLMFMLDAREGKLDGIHPSILSISLSLFSLISLLDQEVGVGQAQANWHSIPPKLSTVICRNELGE